MASCDLAIATLGKAASLSLHLRFLRESVTGEGTGSECLNIYMRVAAK
jgi:hypothetical protein